MTKSAMKVYFIESSSELKLTFLLVYRKQGQPFNICYDILSYFEQQDSHVDVMLGDFNITPLLPVNENILRLLADFTLINTAHRHIWESVIDHVYVRTNMVSSNNVVSDVVNVYFSDHDAVRTIFEFKDML